MGERVAAVDFPYRRLKVTYQLEASLLPAEPWIVVRLLLARMHRFRTERQWRNGALLAYESQDSGQAYHVGRVEAFVKEDRLEVEVTGPFPQNLFALVVQGVDRVIAGLPERIAVAYRLLDCPDPLEQTCGYQFDFDSIFRTSNAIVNCPECGAEIDFPVALLGLHSRTGHLIAELQAELDAGSELGRPPDRRWLALYQQVVSLRQRYYLGAFQAAQINDTAHFLRVFLLKMRHGQIGQVSEANLSEQFISLSACCELPGHWHEVGVDIPLINERLYLQMWQPYLAYMSGVLPTMYHTAEDDFLLLEAIEGTERVIELIVPEGAEDRPRVLNGALASLSDFWVLNREKWAGRMRKVKSPEGYDFWLCEEHAQLFE